jgi:hypothetical protein
MITCEKCKQELNDLNYDLFWEKHQTISDSYNYKDFKIWCVNK